MALYIEWNIKSGFAYVLQFLSLISDSLGGVIDNYTLAVLPYTQIINL